MGELKSNFEKIDQYIRLSVNNESLLDETKELLRSWISNRQMENITNIDDLLGLLRRRGSYNQEEFTVLKAFKKIIPDPIFEDMVEHHRQLLQSEASTNPRNEYGTRLLAIPFFFINCSLSQFIFSSKKYK